MKWARGLGPYPPHRQAAGRPARRKRDRGGLPKDGAGRRAAGTGLAGRLRGVSGLRLRRGPMAGAQGCGPAAPSRSSGSGGRGWEGRDDPAACPGWVLFELPAPPPIHRPRFLKTESSDSQWLPRNAPVIERLRGGPMRAQAREANGGGDRRRLQRRRGLTVGASQ